MKQETLDKLKELHGKATPGPWILAQSSNPGTAENELDMIQGDGGAPVLFGQDEQGGPSWYERDDANLIVETRNALPALLAEIERLNRVVDQAVDEFSLVEVTEEVYRDRHYNFKFSHIGETWIIGYDGARVAQAEQAPDLAAELRARAERAKRGEKI